MLSGRKRVYHVTSGEAEVVYPNWVVFRPRHYHSDTEEEYDMAEHIRDFVSESPVAEAIGHCLGEYEWHCQLNTLTKRFDQPLIAGTIKWRHAHSRRACSYPVPISVNLMISPVYFLKMRKPIFLARPYSHWLAVLFFKVFLSICVNFAFSIFCIIFTLI